MSNPTHRTSSILLPLVIIPVAGLLVLAICYLLYGGVYNLVESLFYPNNPTAVPAGIIRTSYAAALLILYLALLRTKLSDLLKATILIGPLATVLITVFLVFYQQPALAIAAVAILAACVVFLLFRYKKPWFYYYAVAVTVVVAIAYAWPRA